MSISDQVKNILEKEHHTYQNDLQFIRGIEFSRKMREAGIRPTLQQVVTINPTYLNLESNKKY